MPKHYHPAPQDRSEQKSMINAIVPEHVAMQLQPWEVVPEDFFKLLWPTEKYFSIKLTIAVVVIIPRMNNNILETLLITERNEWNAQRLTTKFPSGAMDKEDKGILSAVARESRTETGYEARDIQFSFAAEYSSTKGRTERHIKVFFVAKNHEKVGEPTEKDILRVEWKPLLEIGSTIYIPKNQFVALRPIIDKIMCISSQMMFALMNNHRGLTPMEGEVP